MSAPRGVIDLIGRDPTLACDIRVAQQGDFQIGLPEVNIGILPGGGGTQRLPRVIGTAAALMHILMGSHSPPSKRPRRGSSTRPFPEKHWTAQRKSPRALHPILRNPFAILSGSSEVLWKRLWMRVCG